MSEIGASARIAVIDDDISFREALAALIRALGHVPHTFASAADFIARPVEDFDLMLVDVQMPGMNGLDLLAWLGATGRRVRVVMISSRSEGSVRADALRLGAVSFLEKPFGLSELAAAMEPGWRG